MARKSEKPRGASAASALAVRGRKSAARSASAAEPSAAAPPRPPLRVLTFNWNEGYTALLADVFPGLHVIDRPSMDEQERAWDMRVAAIPEGVRILHDPEAARRALAAGSYDAVICHTVRDLEFVKPLPVAAVLMAHTSLETELYAEPERIDSVKAFLRQLLRARGVLFATPSAEKLASWAIEGDVIPPAVEVDRFGGWVGDEARALVVGDQMQRWNHATGYEQLKLGLRDVPWTLLGNNALDESPGLTLEALTSPDRSRSLHQHCRAYVSANLAPLEDAVSPQLLEAMAYGMPVVMLAHPQSPIRHEKEGLVAESEADLGRLVRRLLEERKLAERLGKQARRRVAKEFSMERFRARWIDFVERAVRHWEAHRVRVVEDERRAQEHLDRGMEHVRAGREEEAEQEFLAAAALAPDSAGPYCNLGAWYLNRGRLEEARHYLELSLFTDPYFLPALLNLARVNLLENVPQAAVPLLEAACAVAPNEASAGALLAMAHLGTRNPAAAGQILLDLEKRGAPEQMIVPLMAQAFRENQEFSLATDAARRWVSVEPGNPDAHRELSQTLLLQGRFEEASAALERAMELDAHK